MAPAFAAACIASCSREFQAFSTGEAWIPATFSLPWAFDRGAASVTAAAAEAVNSERRWSGKGMIRCSPFNAAYCGGA
jgi:hypothetical protein